MDKKEELERYVALLANMNRASVKGFLAPHKPVLLLAVQYLLQTGWLTDNKVILDGMLEDCFCQFWRLKVDDGSSRQIMVCEDLIVQSSNVYPFKCQIANPFYHLGGEPFWTLVKSDQWVSKSNYSKKLLKQYYQYAEIDKVLAELMVDKDCGRIIEAVLDGLI